MVCGTRGIRLCGITRYNTVTRARHDRKPINYNIHIDVHTSVGRVYTRFDFLVMNQMKKYVNDKTDDVGRERFRRVNRVRKRLFIFIICPSLRVFVLRARFRYCFVTSESNLAIRLAEPS